MFARGVCRAPSDRLLALAGIRRIRPARRALHADGAAAGRGGECAGSPPDCRAGRGSTGWHTVTRGDGVRQVEEARRAVEAKALSSRQRAQADALNDGQSGGFSREAPRGSSAEPEGQPKELPASRGQQIHEARRAVRADNMDRKVGVPHVRPEGLPANNNEGQIHEARRAVQAENLNRKVGVLQQPSDAQPEGLPANTGQQIHEARRAVQADNLDRKGGVLQDAQPEGPPASTGQQIHEARRAVQADNLDRKVGVLQQPSDARPGAGGGVRSVKVSNTARAAPSDDEVIAQNLRVRFSAAEACTEARIRGFLGAMRRIGKAVGPRCYEVAAGRLAAHAGPDAALALVGSAGENGVRPTGKMYAIILGQCVRSHPPRASADGTGEGVNALEVATESVVKHAGERGVAVDVHFGTALIDAICAQGGALDDAWAVYKQLMAAGEKPLVKTYATLVQLVRTPQDGYRVLKAMHDEVGQPPRRLVALGLVNSCGTKKQATTLLNRLAADGVADNPLQYTAPIVRVAFKARDFLGAKDSYQRQRFKTPALFCEMLRGLSTLVREADDGYCMLIDDLLAEAEAGNNLSRPVLLDAADAFARVDPDKSAALRKRAEAEDSPAGKEA
ncbi:hypothetical protein DIPPA_12050 [Diplonema papillatum]|nr:hypothetical protein DIPPA_12050 [Diplonema papillatum]